VTAPNVCSVLGDLPQLAMRKVVYCHSHVDSNNLLACVNRALPFSIPITNSMFVNSAETSNLVLGKGAYCFTIENFLQYPLVGTCEKSVSQMNGSWLFCLQALIPNVLLRQDRHNKSDFKPDVTVMKSGAIVMKVESISNENLMSLAEQEMLSKFHETAVDVFPKGQKGIFGLLSCPTLINIYGIFYEEKKFQITLLNSFRVSTLSERCRFLCCWFNIICWVAQSNGPNRSFHLPYNVRIKTPNCHHVTWKGTHIIKEFKTINPIRNERIQSVYSQEFPNVEWGKVISDNSIEIHRLGHRIQKYLHDGKGQLTKVHILEGVMAGLDQLHRMGLAHSDISIDNVFVDRDNDTVFINDLEYLCPLDDPPRPGYGHVSGGKTPKNAQELDDLQLDYFKFRLALL